MGKLIALVLSLAVSLAAQYVPPVGGGGRPLTNTIIPLGDSITASTNSLGQYYPSGDKSPASYFDWANVLSGQRMVMLNNAGVGGQICSQVMARVQSDVIAYHPTFAVVEAGINDVTGGTSASTIIACLQGGYTALLNSGIKVIATTIVPTTSVDSAPKDLSWNTVNAWIREYARKTPGMYLVDFAAAYVDATAAHAQPLAGYTYDGTHPNSTGAYTLGVQLSTLLKQLVPDYPTGASWNGDTNNLVSNGLLAGSDGSLGGTVSGSAPTGWTASNDGTTTCVSSVGSRLDGLGQWSTLAVAGGTLSSSDKCTIYMDIGGSMVGKTVYLQFEAQATNVVQHVMGSLVYNNSSWTPLEHLSAFSQFVAGSLTQVLTVQANGGNTMLFRTNAMLVPTGTAHLMVMIGVVGAGTLKIGRVGVYAVPTP